MKKLQATLFALMLVYAACAQDSTGTSSRFVAKHNVQNQQGVIMRNGRILMMKDGQTTQLTSDLTLDNGAIVMANGNVKGKDGTVITLKDGDYVTMDGTVGNISKWKKDHTMGKDSGASKARMDSLK